MRAFIIRPFGIKVNRQKKKINFDEVEAKLIGPALERLKEYQGRTTGDIVRAGNIREDMFQLLLTADLVIADISIDNANVFYELGIRHALRDKRTFLLRCKGDEVPFDLKTDRYHSYDHDNPAAGLEELVRALQATINGDVQDSPVFKLLPELQVQDHRRFLPVPMGFREDVERATNVKALGSLVLLAKTANGFQWESEGMRLVGRAQFKLKAFADAQRSWDVVRNFDPEDLEANQRLATVYQRLNKLAESDLAVERALRRKGLSSYDRAEVRSLRGSNAKSRWRTQWEFAPLEQQPALALQSGFLGKALNEYEAAFEEDLNHYYAGINALAMRVVQIKLAEALPEVWAERFETDDEAQRELEILRKKSEKLAAAVEFSLHAARKRTPDIWAEVSEAQRVLLTSTRPARVATAYRQALTGAEPFVADAERRQLDLYQRLNILTLNVKSAFAVLDESSNIAPVAAEKTPNSEKKERIILFAGHMLDAPDRTPPRFPLDKEERARQAIRDAILAEQQIAGGIAYGIAGGAHGGDLLFHEVCAELGIKTELWLALPPDDYVRVAVQNYLGGETHKLVERFRHLQQQLTTRVMADTQELPRWLRDKAEYDFWGHHTLWMVYNALTVGAENLTLIALWNGEEGNGTGDFVRRVRERSGKVVPLSTKQLFNL
jgi:hypothetical protein